MKSARDPYYGSTGYAAVPGRLFPVNVNARRDLSVRCLVPGCGKTWPRDPVLEIACPTCAAPIGVKCKRPSGHRIFGEFDFHPQRDLAANAAGKYGPCPRGRCVDAPAPAQPDLFNQLAKENA